jgi:hypothetical protein
MTNYSTVGYSYRGQYLRPEMVQAIQRYVFHGIKPGSFLYAALSNDLMTTLSKADTQNAQSFLALASYVYNEIPSACHGSHKKVEDWLKRLEKEKQLEMQLE